MDIPQGNPLIFAAFVIVSAALGCLGAIYWGKRDNKKMMKKAKEQEKDLNKNMQDIIEFELRKLNEREVDNGRNNGGEKSRFRGSSNGSYWR